MSSKGTVLIVEDERIPAEFLKAFLQREGYIVIAICDRGEDAIRVAQEQRPDIIFMDIMLKSRMSGCDAALQISKVVESKIIFLTAYYDQEMIDFAKEAGAINYLLKPYRDKQILAALEIVRQQDEIPSDDSVCDMYKIPLECGYIYDLEKKRLYHNDQEINLSRKSLLIIHYLSINLNSTVSKEELSRYIYGELKDSSTIRTLIFRLRKQLQCDMIENISGIGYKIVSQIKS